MLSDVQRYEAECQGKRPYRTKADIKTHQKFILSRGGSALRIYKCTWCEQWHSGHANQAKWKDN